MSRYYNWDKYPNADMKNIKAGDKLKYSNKLYEAVRDIDHSCMVCDLYEECFVKPFCNNDEVHFIKTK